MTLKEIVREWQVAILREDDSLLKKMTSKAYETICNFKVRQDFDEAREIIAIVKQRYPNETAWQELEEALAELEKNREPHWVTFNDGYEYFLSKQPKMKDSGITLATELEARDEEIDGEKDRAAKTLEKLRQGQQERQKIELEERERLKAQHEQMMPIMSLLDSTDGNTTANMLYLLKTAFAQIAAERSRSTMVGKSPNIIRISLSQTIVKKE